MITQKDKELLTDWLCNNVKVEPSVISLIVKHVDNYFQSAPAKEELEARDRGVAAEAWDAGYSKCWHNEFGKILPEPPNKETYLNSLINK